MCYREGLPYLTDRVCAWGYLSKTDILAALEFDEILLPVNDLEHSVLFLPHMPY